jgi:hypothetical protein
MAADPNLDPQNIYELFRVDYESAWDALAATSRDQFPGRGNFMFARSAMGLLEFASRLCVSDGSGQALTDFSRELEMIEPRYFVQLPGPSRLPKEFSLPTAGNLDCQLLTLLFDLIRNGQAHQGQQIMGKLSDGFTIGVSLSGVGDRTIRELENAPRSKQHLRVDTGDARRTWINLSPGLLYLDVRRAIDGARLLDRGLALKYLERSFDYDTQELREALAAGGLKRTSEQP